MMEFEGRELDAAVAVLVMGWTRLNPLPSHCGACYGFPPDYRGESPLRVPSYSTDWNAASQVVEKLRETPPISAARNSTGVWFEISSPTAAGRRGRSEWYAGWTSEDDDGAFEIPGMTGKGLTGPEAICRAALACVRAPDAQKAPGPHEGDRARNGRDEER